MFDRSINCFYGHFLERTVTLPEAAFCLFNRLPWYKWHVEISDLNDDVLPTPKKWGKICFSVARLNSHTAMNNLYFVAASISWNWVRFSADEQKHNMSLYNPPRKGHSDFSDTGTR